MVLKQFFCSKNLRKIAQRLGASPADPYSLRRLPSMIRLNYSTLLYTTRLPIQTFSYFNYWFKPSPLERVPNYVPTPGQGFWSSILRYLCPHKKFFFWSFWWRHCMQFVVWASPIKNPGYAYGLKSKNKLRASKRKQISNRQMKLNLTLIQNDKTLKIFLCLEA